jgi:hypothetical protein
MWITCGDSVVGSKIFIYKQSGGLFVIAELTAYERYFVQQNTYSFYDSTLPVSGSNWGSIILKEINVMRGTETSCYTSLT